MTDITARNHVTITGEGERIIMFAHGFGCDQSMWRYILPSFEKDYRIVLFDYVGSGRSDIHAYTHERYGSIEGYVQDVLEIIEELDLANITFVGHSISAMIGMLASIKQPDRFEKLIMIGPSPCYLNEADGYVGGFERSDILELLDMMEMNYAGWASFMAPIAINDPDSPSLTEELKKSFIAINPVIAKQFAEVTFFSDHREQLASASVPTLIMQCSQDSIVPLEVGQYLQRHLPNSTLSVIEAKGHYPHISHPKETVQLIQQYLQI